MKYKWIIKKTQIITDEFLNVAYNSEIIAKLLLNRGIDSSEKAKSYLNPEFYKETKPEEIPNLIRAKDRIVRAINKKEKITIFGDYDVDGVTSTSCLLITLKQFTDKVDFYIPNRLTEGYGLNLEAVRTISKKHKANLLITCDCGITNSKEIELANELGMDVIVTDHHSLPEVLPPAHAILNPKLLSPDHKLYFLPGVGVAYKLAEAILEHLSAAEKSCHSQLNWESSQTKNIVSNLDSCFRGNDISTQDQQNSKKFSKDDLLDLVTLGMIADLAPLVDENRYLVQTGLKKLAITKKVGLKELLRMCGCLSTEKNGTTTEHVGFGIAPRINAVGRLTEAALAVRLMTTENLLEAIHIASELEIQNKHRQFLCEQTLSDAVTLVSEQIDLKESKCIVLASNKWHHGVIGIVASRIVEKFGLPTILIAIDKEQNIAKGSGRSIGKLNIFDALVKSSRVLEKYGGHKAACGLSVKPEFLHDFISDFTNTVNVMLENTDMSPILEIDLELPLSELNIDFLNLINKLSPFGLGNPVPYFLSEEVEITGIRSIGKNRQHLKLVLKTESNSRRLSESICNDKGVFEALIWNHDQNIQFNPGDKVKIVYTPKINNYNGEVFIQLEVKDFDITNSPEILDFADVSVSNTSALQDLSSSLIKTQIGIYDRRDRVEDCLESLRQESSIVYFSETEQKSYLPLKTFSRNKIIKGENLVFLESPPDEIVLINVIKTCNPRKIYFAFPRFQELSPQSLALRTLKKLTGMLRYVKTSRNSKVTDMELQTALGINKTATAYALETLVQIGFLIFERIDDKLNININEPTRQNFDQLIEYNLLISELRQILEFKQWISKIDLIEIEKILNQNHINAKFVLAEEVRLRL